MIDYRVWTIVEGKCDIRLAAKTALIRERLAFELEEELLDGDETAGPYQWEIWTADVPVGSSWNLHPIGMELFESSKPSKTEEEI